MVVLTGFWSWLIKDLLIDLRPRASAHERLRFLVGHFWLVAEIAFNTLKDSKSLLLPLAGVLGWLEVKLPKGFYFVALPGILCAFALEATRSCALGNVDRVIRAGVSVGTIVGRYP